MERLGRRKLGHDDQLARYAGGRTQRRRQGISGFAGDTASFGDSIGSSAATVSLDGQNPVLNSLSFATHLGGSYNITSGSGGQITVNGGTADSVITVNGGNQQISAQLVLAGTADFNIVNPQDSLTVAGNIGGQSPINKLAPDC